MGKIKKNGIIILVLNIYFTLNCGIMPRENEFWDVGGYNSNCALTTENYHNLNYYLMVYFIDNFQLLNIVNEAIILNEDYGYNLNQESLLNNSTKIKKIILIEEYSAYSERKALKDLEINIGKKKADFYFQYYYDFRYPIENTIFNVINSTPLRANPIEINYNKEISIFDRRLGC